MLAFAKQEGLPCKKGVMLCGCSGSPGEGKLRNIKERLRDFLQGHVLTGQGGMSSN